MRLAICIPTYNRGPFLGQLFDSILAQTGYTCDLEVVVSDNASTDNTREVVAAYRDRFAAFVYERAETNQGADRNFLKVVELASADYCWLMGSDDILEPGSVAEIERRVADHPDAGGFLLHNNSYDYAMAEKLARGSGEGRALPETTVLRGAEAIFTALGELFGYISSNVIRRDLWQEVTQRFELEPYFNAWIHVYVIGRMLQKRPEWVYVAYPCVGWRSGNDSFLSEGMYRRLAIDVEGYDKITAALFGDGSEVHRSIMKKILHHARFRIASAKLNGMDKAFFVKARSLMGAHYRGYASYWLSVYPITIAPPALMKLVKHARNSLKSGPRSGKLSHD